MWRGGVKDVVERGERCGGEGRGEGCGGEGRKIWRGGEKDVEARGGVKDVEGKGHITLSAKHLHIPQVCAPPNV